VRAFVTASQLERRPSIAIDRDRLRPDVRVGVRQEALDRGLDLALIPVWGWGPRARPTDLPRPSGCPTASVIAYAVEPASTGTARSPVPTIPNVNSNDANEPANGLSAAAASAAVFTVVIPALPSVAADATMIANMTERLVSMMTTGIMIVSVGPTRVSRMRETSSLVDQLRPKSNVKTCLAKISSCCQ